MWLYIDTSIPPLDNKRISEIAATEAKYYFSSNLFQKANVKDTLNKIALPTVLLCYLHITRIQESITS